MHVALNLTVAWVRVDKALEEEKKEFVTKLVEEVIVSDGCMKLDSRDDVAAFRLEVFPAQRFTSKMDDDVGLVREDLM